MTQTRGHLGVCPICGGLGATTFERGPAVELCPACAGTGRTYSEPELRGLFAAILAQEGPEMDPAMRLLLRGMAALDDRIASLERRARDG